MDICSFGSPEECLSDGPLQLSRYLLEQETGPDGVEGTEKVHRWRRLEHTRVVVNCTRCRSCAMLRSNAALHKPLPRPPNARV